MMNDGLPRKIAACRTLQGLFELLRSYPLLGDFLAYQYAIDLNYSDAINFEESEFVVPGPRIVLAAERFATTLHPDAK